MITKDLDLYVNYKSLNGDISSLQYITTGTATTPTVTWSSYTGRTSNYVTTDDISWWRYDGTAIDTKPKEREVKDEKMEFTESELEELLK